MEEYTFINPDNQDSIVLHIELDFEINVWRVYVQGDRGIKPLYSGSNAVAARKVFDDVKAGMMERLK